MNLSPSAWRGIAALILATGLAATVIILAVETVLHSGSISTQEASLLSTVLGAVVGAVAVYLGGHNATDDTTTKGGGDAGGDTGGTID